MSLVLGRCFKAMSLVRIYPNVASLPGKILYLKILISLKPHASGMKTSVSSNHAHAFGPFHHVWQQKLSL